MTYVPASAVSRFLRDRGTERYDRFNPSEWITISAEGERVALRLVPEGAQYPAPVRLGAPASQDLLRLATRFSHHPDYDPAWKPDCTA